MTKKKKIPSQKINRYRLLTERASIIRKELDSLKTELKDVLEPNEVLCTSSTEIYKSWVSKLIPDIAKLKKAKKFDKFCKPSEYFTLHVRAIKPKIK